MKQAQLLLQDGSLLTGYALGAVGTKGGECCFNTAMTGYQEIHSDPSYHGQILLHTAAHIGNYGVHELEQESHRAHIQGVVLNTYCEKYSRYQACDSLGSWLEKRGVVGMWGINVRQLLRHIVQNQIHNAVLSTEGLDRQRLQKHLDEVPDMQGASLSEHVTTDKSYDFGSGHSWRVAVWDLGIKQSILRCLEAHNIGGRVFGLGAGWEEIDAYGADGYVLSNGPGDPGAMEQYLPLIHKMLESNKPLMGICLGHQLLARSFGVDTYKLAYGHRGVNHSVWDWQRKQGLTTAQNHGFVVDKDSLEACDRLESTHINLNDDTVAGLKVKGRPAFSVQFHPEASAGPHDARYLFDNFVTLLHQWKKSHTS